MGKSLLTEAFGCSVERLGLAQVLRGNGGPGIGPIEALQIPWKRYFRLLGLPKQEAYNREHGITPETIKKSVDSPLDELLRAGSLNVDKTKSVAAQAASRQATDPEQEIKRLKKQMKAAAAKLEFERAAEIRDLIRELQALVVGA